MAEEWNRALEVHPSSAAGRLYAARPGDTLCAIARRFEIPLAALVQANPQLAEANLLYPGQIVRVPALPPPGGCPRGSFYTVRPGESLFAIAARFGLSLQALLAANPQVADSNEIHAGQTICIPAVPPVVLPPVPGFIRFGCPFGIAICPMRGSCPFHGGPLRGRKRRRRRDRRESWGCY
ncbi:MAG: LysM peptidoglycan-binding domain-containing protein [Firmicutes bacterium]|nr:LysM peptidoglycan-binding domain-containing protein [Bacillota bacterium]